MAAEARLASAGIYAEPRPSVATTRRPSVATARTDIGNVSHDSRSFRSVGMLQTQAEGGKKRHSLQPRWLGHVKNWLSVSEPSAQAMKAQKKMTYKKYGVELDDPRAAAKMHLPIGKVPEGVTTSTKGPSPEKALRMRTQETMAQRPYLEHSRSISSGFSIASSRGGKQAVAPWT
ncbi:hypothetical protein XA68_10848 [Ophiocordyceps unilateralis]|uniref:Uncharacterized protein n=1 Tax=Ophiocordyceps unilateralis TaxID=268505 RepID=A0A2A9PGI6_OPHUN|nr:hypothetical protein XA68_10848 [Ophiocordyceps unilateralis]